MLYSIFLPLERAFLKEKTQKTDSLSGFLLALYRQKNSSDEVFQNSISFVAGKEYNSG